MDDNSIHTITTYLGAEYQMKIMWQLLVEPEFAEKAMPSIAVEYFDDPNMKRLFIIMLEYKNEYDKVPNLQNKSIYQAINQFKSTNNIIEEESLFSVLKTIINYNQHIINKQMLFDGDAIQKSFNSFIKQQEFRKLGEYIITQTKSGEIKKGYVITAIEERFKKINEIGVEDDNCELLTEGVEKALRKDFRETIPTGIEVIDAVTGGGLGKSEFGLILTPSGVGKTTILTKIANTAYELEKNVAQIIFEDTVDQVKRKHYVIWSKSALTKLDDDDENARVTKVVYNKINETQGKGNLVIKRFTEATIVDVRNWMLSYQKKFGIKFDILILDYLDCLDSHKKTRDSNEAELAIVKGFETLAADFNIPAWSAIQSNRSGFDTSLVEAYQTGGSIKRVQKAHFFMSVGKSKEQKLAELASIRIIKARFAKDGQTFEDCIFNNDTLTIRIEDDRYKNLKMNKGKKHYDTEDILKLEEKVNNMHVAINKEFSEATSISKANSYVDDSLKENVLANMLDTYNAQKNNVVDFPENPVKIENVEEIIVESNQVEEISNNVVTPVVEIVENNNIINVVNDIESNVNETDFLDPDDVAVEHKTVFDLLKEKREKQKGIIND